MNADQLGGLQAQRIKSWQELAAKAPSRLSGVDIIQGLYTLSAIVSAQDEATTSLELGDLLAEGVEKEKLLKINAYAKVMYEAADKFFGLGLLGE